MIYKVVNKNYYVYKENPKKKKKISFKEKCKEHGYTAYPDDIKYEATDYDESVFEILEEMEEEEYQERIELIEEGVEMSERKLKPIINELVDLVNDILDNIKIDIYDCGHDEYDFEMNYYTFKSNYKHRLKEILKS